MPQYPIKALPFLLSSAFQEPLQSVMCSHKHSLQVLSFSRHPHGSPRSHLRVPSQTEVPSMTVWMPGAGSLLWGPQSKRLSNWHHLVSPVVFRALTLCLQGVVEDEAREAGRSGPCPLSQQAWAEPAVSRESDKHLNRRLMYMFAF